ncbi:MAG: phosphoribosylformylglycinamidine cyclo-ligase [Acidobacteria bacterium]|nr:phosphoribosylformylglycinamidine cyclo-ligase [Acidobacteriota bacterium]
MTKPTTTTYRDAGVDIDAQDEALSQVRRIVRDTYSENVVSELGLFGGLYRANFPDLESPILVSSADGVGTKLKVARDMKIHDTIGGDLVNHCVNDILVQGARPLFFLDYFATGKLEPAVMVDVVRGMAEACRENRLALIGGETAEMPGFYRPGEYDVAGFIVGVVDEKHLIDGSRVREGDIILGLPSSGLHTNGYSLARKIVDDAGLDMQSVVPDLERKVGEELLRPHLSYLRQLGGLVEEDRLSAMAHITGGGLTDNIPRVLPSNLDARIKLGSWEIPPLFSWLVATGGVDRIEALRVFNMGIGMVLFVAVDHVPKVVAHLQQHSQKLFFIGNVVKGEGKVDYDTPPAGFASWDG